MCNIILAFLEFLVTVKLSSDHVFYLQKKDQLKSDPLKKNHLKQNQIFCPKLP